jgi:predicted enzyme related to lactoylglutathione lyase
MSPARFLGLRTTIYPVTDLAKARSWYSEVLGVKPYFDEPFYVGFNVGGFELGLDPDTSAQPPGAAGGVAYWGVEKADEAWARLLKLGATPASPVRDVGGGIRVATVKDPFGNVFGIIENPHFPNTAS